MQPEPAGIDHGEERPVVEGSDTAQRAAHLLDAQDSRELRLPLRPQELEERPVPLQHLLEEEANPGVTDAEACGDQRLTFRRCRKYACSSSAVIWSGALR